MRKAQLDGLISTENGDFVHFEVEYASARDRAGRLKWQRSILKARTAIAGLQADQHRSFAAVSCEAMTLPHYWALRFVYFTISTMATTMPATILITITTPTRSKPAAPTANTRFTCLGGAGV